MRIAPRQRSCGRGREYRGGLALAPALPTSGRSDQRARWPTIPPTQLGDDAHRMRPLVSLLFGPSALLVAIPASAAD
jgi:hypothetical protein